MPQIFKIWANENDPLEPIHVHIAAGGPPEMQQKSGLPSRAGAFCATITRKLINTARNY